MKPDPPCLLLLTLLSGTSKLRVRVPRMNAGGATIGAATRFSILSGRVLTPGSSGDGWWDGRCAAMPIVLPPSASRSKWQCFFRLHGSQYLICVVGLKLFNLLRISSQHVGGITKAQHSIPHTSLTKPMNKRLTLTR